MAETFVLDQTSRRVVLGSSGKRMRAPGLRGTVTWRAAAEHAALLADAAPDIVDQALAEAGLEDQGSLSLDATTPTSAPRLAISAPGTTPNKIVVDTTIPADEVQFAIYRDEDGVISLHLPVALPTAGAAANALAAAAVPASVPGAPARPPIPTHHYLIQLRQPQAAPAAPPKTAMLGGVLGKVIRFVGRKILGGLVGDAVYLAAKAWEDLARANQGFHGGADATALLANPPQPVPNWPALQGNKALLFLHGTTSSTSSAFAGLSQFSSSGDQLYQQYGNRVIGFNHHTLTKSVAQNAIDFYNGLPAGNYTFDIISHSRGGLLARTLKELTPAQLAELANSSWTPPAGTTFQVNKIMLVGAPDLGTPLADPNDLAAAVSRLASILTTFSAVVAEIGLGALLTIFGGIVEGGVGALPGLEDMNPGSPFLAELNTPPLDPEFYFGVEADYQPTGSLARAIENNGIDALFLGELNDLVVPTLGVSVVKGQTLPPAQVDEYGETTGVYHLNYFHQAGTWDKILQFLPDPSMP